jgi:hypothetical protein
MGTFHQGRHELHGITVVVDTAGPDLYVGRCDDMDEEAIVLLDADRHRDEPGGPSKAAYLERAARFGVFRRFARVAVPRAGITSIRRLGDL